jgi:hypothetical protein
MVEIDAIASDLFEEAKRFLEKAREVSDKEGEKAYLHAALLLGVSALEAHVNAIAVEMLDRGGKSLNTLERSVLLEREFSFNNGEFTLTNKLKMYNLIERIEFILFKFSGKRINPHEVWWSNLHEGIDLRNSLVHPKSKQDLTLKNVKSAFEGILSVLDELYLALYKQHFPALGRKFDSKMQF